MRTYVLYFALIVILANLGYALAHLGQGKDAVVSLPLMLGSICAAAFALMVIRRRFRQAKDPEKK